MQLTPNFTLSELTATATGLDNVPSEDQTRSLLFLTVFLLQPIRDRWGRIRVNSAFRSAKVNRAIGGAAGSQHQDGEAADIVPEDAAIDEVFRWCRENLRFGQAILETKGSARWIHISLPRLGKQNGEVLAYENGTYTKLQEGTV